MCGQLSAIVKSEYLHNLGATHPTSQGAQIDTKAAFVE